MSISIHCTLFFFTLAALVLISSSFCVRSASAEASTPSPPLFSPADHCLSPPPTPSCRMVQLFSDALPPPTNLTNLLLFNQSCLLLHTNLLSCGPFAIDIADNLPVGNASSLALALYRSSVPLNVELIFNFSFRTSCPGAADNQESLLAACESEKPQTQEPTSSSCSAAGSGSSGSQFSYYSISLTYSESSAELSVQAKVIYGGGGLEINQAYVLNITDLQQGVGDAHSGQDDNISLLVSFATEGQATVNITPPSLYTPYGFSDPIPPHPHDPNSKSSHTKVVVWAVLGVSMVAFVAGLMILALAIKKKYCTCPPPLVSWHGAGRAPIGGPTSTTTRAVFPSHPRLESSTTPMMNTVCLSPPYHIDDFHISGIPSWLNKPNPR